MSDPTAGLPPPPPPRSPASNALGLAGFIVSLVTFVFTCGILCPVGLVLSLFGLRKEPRGFAIAGAIIGGIGSIVAVLWGLAFVLVALGVKEAIDEEGSPLRTGLGVVQAMAEIEKERNRTGSLPDQTAGQAIVAKYKDGWDRDLRYDLAPPSYAIRSAGADGAFDTVDDVVTKKD
jgi:hypothetical protein